MYFGICLSGKMGIINAGIANLTFLASASYFIIRGDVSFFRRDNYATKVLFIQNAFAVTNRNWKSFLQICKDVFCCEALREMELNSLNSKTFWKPPQHSVSKLSLASLNMKWGEKRTLVLLLKFLSLRWLHQDFMHQYWFLFCFCVYFVFFKLLVYGI